MDKLKEIKARVDRASKGPWDHRSGVVRCPNDAPPVQSGNLSISTSHRPVAECVWCYPEGQGMTHPKNENGLNDAVFIAHSREDIPYLLDLIALYQRALRI